MTGLWLIIATVRAFTGFAVPPEAATQPLGTPRAIGEALFSDYVLPFEIASLILLAAMVGAIVLARETAREEERPTEALTEPPQPDTQEDQQPV